VPRALELVGLFWGLYGFVMGLLGGVLEPAVEGLSRALMDLGLRRSGGGYSAIEALVARGEYEAAAEAYRERAQVEPDRVDATLRRAALLAGVLREPETAAAELQNLRESDHRLTAEEDLRIGLALVELHEDRLADPGRAMAELRRLIDRYPSSRHLRRLRAELAALKQQRFGDASTP
jgi:tetratricopeptide (TPR) repeat protein